MNLTSIVVNKAGKREIKQLLDRLKNKDNKKNEHLDDIKKIRSFELG